MSAIDLQAFRAAELAKDPYDFVIVPGFLKEDALSAIEADYPSIAAHGSFPVSELDFGPAFGALLDELQGPEIERAFAEKFDVDLTHRPTMVTARGRCHAKDGRIHTDSADKVITVLVYVNSDWRNDGGRLRVLRSPGDIEDFAAEVPPRAGTLLAFRRSDKSYHGHKRFVGERRVIQLNWVRDESVVRREQSRHRFSARLKKWVPFA